MQPTKTQTIMQHNQIATPTQINAIANAIANHYQCQVTPLACEDLELTRTIYLTIWDASNQPGLLLSPITPQELADSGMCTITLHPLPNITLVLGEDL